MDFVGILNIQLDRVVEDFKLKSLGFKKTKKWKIPIVESLVWRKT
jgi:hypothetical protein